MSGPANSVAPAPERTGRLDLALAIGLALAAGALYALTFQTRYYGDGPGLVTLHVLGSNRAYYHALYLPLCDAVQRALGVDPFLATRLLSIVPAALGLGLGYLVLRAFAAPRFGALVAAGLLAVAPSLWFFATTVEVHALLFCVVAAVAVLTLHAPWLRPRLTLALVALAFPILYWAHQAAFVMGPGWVLLVQYARSRRGAAYSWRGLLVAVGPLLLLALVAGAFAAAWYRFGSLEGMRHEYAHQIVLQEAYDGHQLPTPPVWRDEWLLPLGVLLPLAVAGAARLRRVPWRAPAVAALVLVPTAFFLWWSVYERGGYLLGCAPFLLVPVALLLGSRASLGRLVLALGLLALQATWGWRDMRGYDRGWDPAEREAQVRAALGTEGVLLVSSDLAPQIGTLVPAIEEYSLIGFVRKACLREKRLVSPADVVAQIRPILERLPVGERPVAAEVGYARVVYADSSSICAFREHLAAIEALLRETYRVRDLPHPDWPMIVLEPRE